MKCYVDANGNIHLLTENTPAISVNGDVTAMHLEDSDGEIYETKIFGSLAELEVHLESKLNPVEGQIRSRVVFDSVYPANDTEGVHFDSIEEEMNEDRDWAVNDPTEFVKGIDSDVTVVVMEA